MRTSNADESVPTRDIDLRAAFKISVVFASAHLSLLVLIHLQNYFVYVAPARSSAGVTSSATTFLLSFHVDNLLASALVGLAMALGAAVSRLTKWVGFAVVTAIHLYLLINQSFFKLFFANFDLSQLEGGAGLRNLRDSFSAEVDGVFGANCLVVLTISVILARTLITHSRHRAPAKMLWQGIVSKHKNGLLISAACLVALTIASVALSAVPSGAQHHPLVSLVTTPGAPPPRSSTVPRTVEQAPLILERIHRPIWGDRLDDPATGRLLQSVADDIESHVQRPNIVLIVLESVGSLQLLSDEGLPSQSVTPHLSDLCQHAIVFDTVYTISPGTTAAHVALSTGGLSSTQGSAYMELQYAYDAPTLVGSLEARGYDTALFSSQALDFGNLSGFYQKLGYDRFYDFKDATPEYKQANGLHSWGAEERATIDLALEWLDNRAEDNAPFFLHYVTNATHHPYSVPAGYAAPFPGDDRKTRYTNALHYTDSIIETLSSEIRARGLLDNTLIAITGDHGEAFSERHAENLGHRNRLYEENVRSFLIIASSGLISDTIASDRIGALGDIMPTLLDFVAGSEVNVPGRSLVTRDFEPRVIFSHKDSAPPMWTIRDGPWKFIGERIGRAVELYNLDDDPLERGDLSAQHPEMVERYDELAASWHVALNDGFTARLRGYSPLGGRFLEQDEVRTPGPKNVAFGRYLHGPEGRRFQPQSAFAPDQELVVWTQYVQFRGDTTVTYRWRSPSGAEHGFGDTVRAGTTHTRIIADLPRPLEEGLWRVTVLVGDEVQVEALLVVHPSVETVAEDHRPLPDATVAQ